MVENWPVLVISTRNWGGLKMVTRAVLETNLTRDKVYMSL